MGLFANLKRQLRPLFGQKEAKRLLEQGLPGTAVVAAITVDTRPRGHASWYRMGLDLEVTPQGRPAYRVANDYLVPGGAEIQQGTELPVRIDPDDPARIAIDWDNAPREPALGEIRPA